MSLPKLDLDALGFFLFLSTCVASCAACEIEKGHTYRTQWTECIQHCPEGARVRFGGSNGGCSCGVDR